MASKRRRISGRNESLLDPSLSSSPGLSSPSLSRHPCSKQRRPITNYMETEEILDLVFQKCPVNELKTCRLVSKQWFYVSEYEWKRSSVLTIRDNVTTTSDEHGRKDGILLSEWNSITSKTELQETNGLQRPYRSYKLFQMRMQSSQVDYQKLLVTSGGWIRNLRVCHSITNMDYRQLCLVFLHCSNLEELVLEDPPIVKTKILVEENTNEKNKDKKEINFPAKFQNLKFRRLELLDCEDSTAFEYVRSFILDHIPNLKHLTLSGLINPEKLGKEINLINELRKKDSRFVALTHLDLQHMKWRKDESPSILGMSLIEARFPLKYLGLNLDLFSEDDATEIFSKYSGSLEGLGVKQLFAYEATTPPPESSGGVPYFKNLLHELNFTSLRKLKLNQNVPHDFDFLLRIPILETLTWRCSELGKKTAAEDKKNQSLESLKLNHAANKPSAIFPKLREYHFKSSIHDRLNSLDVHYIRSLMPNLKSITLPVRQDGVEPLLSLWPEIEEICIWHSFGVEALGQSGDQKSGSNHSVREWGGNFQAVGPLKALRKLVIRSAHNHVKTVTVKQLNELVDKLPALEHLFCAISETSLSICRCCQDFPRAKVSNSVLWPQPGDVSPKASDRHAHHMYHHWFRQRPVPLVCEDCKVDRSWYMKPDVHYFRLNENEAFKKPPEFMGFWELGCIHHFKY